MSQDTHADMLPASSQHDHLDYISEIQDPGLFWSPSTEQQPLVHGARRNLQTYARLLFNGGETWLGAAASEMQSDNRSREGAQQNITAATRHAVRIRDQSNAYQLEHAAHADEHPCDAHQRDYVAARATAATLAGRVLGFAASTLEYGQASEATLRANAALYFEHALSSNSLPPILALDAGTAAVRNAVASGDIQRAAELRRAIAPTVARVVVAHAYELSRAWSLIRERTSFENSDRDAALESIRRHP